MTRSHEQTSRRVADGGRQRAGSHGVTQYYADSIPLPSGSIRSPVPALKSLNLSQALIDGLVVVAGLVALVVVFGSLPLAVGLMLFGVF
jgi:hypothetical protein